MHYKLRVAIDMRFDEFMTPRDQKRTVVQLSWCYSVNRRAPSPLQFYVVNFSGPSRQCFCENYERWDVNVTEEPVDRVFNKEDIVYLTADSDNVIDDLDNSKAYIIGGLIDHNSCKNLCLNIANKEGFAHARLPIGEFIKMNSRKVLTINHVFEILVRRAQGASWAEAFLSVLPQRKSEAEEGQIQSEEPTAQLSASSDLKEIASEE